MNEYLAGLIKEDHLKKEAKIWNNYTTDYAPLVEFAKEQYPSHVEIRGAVLQHCLSTERLYIAVEHLQTSSFVDQDGNEIEIEVEKTDLLIYNSCGELIGNGDAINNASVQDSYEEEIETLLNVDITIVWDVSIFTFIDGHVEYYVDIRVDGEKRF